MLRRLAFVMLMGASAALLPNTAFAQDEGEQPAPPPPPPPPPAPAPAPARRVTVATPPAAPGSFATDHEEIIGSLGFQIAATFPGAGPVPGITNVGMRYWFNDKIALDAGFGVTVGNDGNNTGVGFGLDAGVPIAIGVYKHITTFFEPTLAFFLLKSPTDADPVIDFNVAGSLGFEWQLGWVEASRISLTLRIGAGLNVVNAPGPMGGASNTTVVFGTGLAPVNGSSVENLFSSTFALTFYL
jgi:hypothetical protein